MEAERPYELEGPAERTRGSQRAKRVGRLRGHRRRRHPAARAGESPPPAGRQRFADWAGQLSPPRGNILGHETNRWATTFVCASQLPRSIQFGQVTRAVGSNESVLRVQ